MNYNNNPVYLKRHNCINIQGELKPKHEIHATFVPDFSLKNILKGNGYRIYRKIIQGHDFKKKALELAKKLGQPSIRDGGKGVWDIQARKTCGTFSETSSAADFHTDAQYHDNPESAFILACEIPAASGGESFLLTVRDVKAELSETKWQTEELALLWKPVWRWRVPDIFCRLGVSKISTPKAVISDEGSICWRFDNLVFDSEQQKRVANKFRDLLRKSTRIVNFKLYEGDVLVCCNKTVLHGRTSFSGCARKLYRVRLL